MPFVGVPALATVGRWLWIVVATVAVDRRARLLFAWAYARGEASYLAVTEYSAFLWASALGWLVFQRAGVALHARRARC